MATKATKTNLENYILIKLDYNKHLILPYSDGLKVFEGLSKAEILRSAYGEPRRIRDIKEDDISIHFITAREYDVICTESIISGDEND